MSGSMINGFVNNQGQASGGSKYTSSLLSSDPFTVVVTFNKAFSASKPPIGVATPNGNSNGQTCSVQVANTSLTFTSATATPFSFMVTDKGLGYY